MLIQKLFVLKTTREIGFFPLASLAIVSKFVHQVINSRS